MFTPQSLSPCASSLSLPSTRITYETIWCKDTAKEPSHGNQAEQTSKRKPKKGPTLNCLFCRAVITTPKHRIRYDGKHEHVFANPSGYIYRIGCFDEAPGCGAVGAFTPFWSWFPGTQWQMAHCGSCTKHLGWRYRNDTKLFYGLVLDYLIEVEDNDDEPSE